MRTDGNAVASPAPRWLTINTGAGITSAGTDAHTDGTIARITNEVAEPLLEKVRDVLDAGVFATCARTSARAAGHSTGSSNRADGLSRCSAPAARSASAAGTTKTSLIIFG